MSGTANTRQCSHKATTDSDIQDEASGERLRVSSVKLEEFLWDPRCYFT